jgi:hypothetical protein
MSASRDGVSKLEPRLNILISLIQPSCAHMSMSPTKLAESFAAGISAIYNLALGDVANLMQELDAGTTADAESEVVLAG